MNTFVWFKFLSLVKNINVVFKNNINSELAYCISELCLLRIEKIDLGEYIDF